MRGCFPQTRRHQINIQNFKEFIQIVGKNNEAATKQQANTQPDNSQNKLKWPQNMEKC